MTANYSNWLIFARILIASVFIVAALINLYRWPNTIQYMESKKIPLTEFFLAGAIALKLLAGVAILFNFHIQIAAAALIFFVLVANVLFNNFWAVAGPQRLNVVINFFVNISLVGTFILLMVIYSQ